MDAQQDSGSTSSPTTWRNVGTNGYKRQVAPVSRDLLYQEPAPGGSQLLAAERSCRRGLQAGHRRAAGLDAPASSRRVICSRPAASSTWLSTATVSSRSQIARRHDRLYARRDVFTSIRQASWSPAPDMRSAPAVTIPAHRAVGNDRGRRHRQHHAAGSVRRAERGARVPAGRLHQSGGPRVQGGRTCSPRRPPPARRGAKHAGKPTDWARLQQGYVETSKRERRRRSWCR